MIGQQEPRVSWVPDYVSSTGQEAIELAAMAGLMLDPWQQYVLVNALGEKPDKKWAAFEVGVEVARQNGKGALIEARELAGAYLLQESLMIHSAHLFDTSIEAFLRMDALLEGCSDLSRRVLRVSRAHGSEGFTFMGGPRLRYRTRTKGGGRGFTGDLLILDEAMILPEAFHGALLPTLSAKSVEGNPQVWYTGSAVDQFVHEDGRVFARIRERGQKGDAEGLAWFEWSVPGNHPDDVDTDTANDQEAWAQANPGLGIRISLGHIAKEQASMDRRTFAVERLGVGDWPNLDDAADMVIDPEAWGSLADGMSAALDPVCFAFDTTPDRAWSTISVAGRRADGLSHIEVVDRRRGTGWLLERMLELDEAHLNTGFVCDGRGPVGSLLPEIEKSTLTVIPVTSTEHAQACGIFYDAVQQRTLRHRGSAELASAIRGATKRPLGEAWAWSRRTSVDISPLVSATLALYGLLTASPAKETPRVIDLSTV